MNETIIMDQAVWLDNYNEIYVNSTSKTIRLTHCYGKARKYSICAFTKFTDLKKDIKKLKQAITEEKKYIQPLTNCTHYMGIIN